MLIDNVKVDNGIVINDFDTEFDTFTPETATITKVETYFDGTPSQKPSYVYHAPSQSLGASLTLQGSSLSFTTTRSGNVSLDVFDLQGNRVASLYKGALSAGTHQFSLSGMARGSYLVRAKGAGLSATKRIVIK